MKTYPVPSTARDLMREVPGPLRKERERQFALGSFEDAADRLKLICSPRRAKELQKRIDGVIAFFKKAD